MNRIYTLSALLLVGGGLCAQRVGQTLAPGTHTLQVAGPSLHPAAHPASNLNGERQIVFTEDFANGLAGDNGVGAWTVMGANGNVWRRATASTPVGNFNNGSASVASPTANNGFMEFNSDSVNTDFSVTPPIAVDPRVPLTGSLVSPTLDLSASPAVIINFTQRFRYCCSTSTAGTHFMDVSTDGGSTWATRFNVEGGIDDNDDSGTMPILLNLTGAIAADPSNVKIRFVHDGANNGISAYFWQVDDINIETAPPNELIMDYGYTSQFGGGYEYGRVPASQMGSDINVGAGVINFGGNTQDNVSVHVSLVQDATQAEVGTLDIPVGTMPPGDTMVADGYLTVPTPMTPGLYVAHFTMTSDSIALDNNPDNNIATRYFEVTDNLYSLDAIDVLPDNLLHLSSAGTSSFTDNTQDVRLLNYYEVHNPQTFTGVQIYMASQAQAGSYFTVSVYDTTDVLAIPADLSAPLMESDIHVITAAEDASRIADIHFLDPLPLGAGAYFISANMFQEGGHNLVILDDTSIPQPSIASMLWLPVDDPSEQHLYGGNGTAWAVRLSSDISINVKENANLEGVNVYPNPTNGILHVTSSKAQPLTVEVRNVLGQIVKTATFNGTSNTLDISGNTAGIYTVRVGNGTNFTVERIALK